MGLAIDHGAAAAADAFAAVVLEGDGFLALQDELLVDDIEHLEEGHVRGNVASLVFLELARCVGASLTPDS
jgi:hypothetical protein